MTERPAAPLRKFVTPALAGACIPDPAHPGLDLPQGGAEVDWDHHWRAMEARGEIVATEIVTPQTTTVPAAKA